MFTKEIDLNDRKAMIDFLENHFRYNTMNSWNCSTSYANDVKLYNIGLTREQEDKLYEIMDCDGAYDSVNELLDDFAYNHNFNWQVGFNGRSGGYLVLYQGGKNGNRVYTKPGKDTDMYADFEDWDDCELRERVKLVTEFDQLCDDVIEKAKYMADNYDVVEETEYVPTQVKSLRYAG